MKYKLNELSLVDNPANPGCSFMLVKNIDGVPYQTEIVEDVKKMVITEAVDPLAKEVNEHREKADALIRKVLDTDELDRLSDDDFGVIRKSVKDSVLTKERILPMPDKMHAVRALEILKNYGLSKEEEAMVHEKAKEILGHAYDTYKNLNRGGEDTVSNETLSKLVEMIEGLTKTVGELVKAWEGSYRPVPGSKETPKDADTTPKLGESSPEQSGAADGVQTQPEEGVAPAKGVNKATNVATSCLETQESPAAPAGSNPDGPAPKSAGKDPAESDLKTQPDEGAYPAKGPIKVADVEEETEEEDKKKKEEEEEAEEEKAAKAVNIKKLGGSENDLSKLHNDVESLRKRFDEVLETMSNPKPRKFKIEKNLEDEKPAGDELQLQKDIAQVQEWKKSGKQLTRDQERFQDITLNKMLSSKFGH
jgi:transcription termination factor NusB